jgi:amino acid transporter
MGPLLGSIAGLGTWFSLSFKGALALVGGAPYIVLLLDVPPNVLALGIAGALIVVNLAGVKQTGRFQVAMVTVMLAVMAWFSVESAGSVDIAQFDGFFEGGISGLLGATGFVYVSYAGVTKVASIAEEIEDPDRNIPLGMLGSLGVTTLLYVLIVFVIVGAAPAGELAGSVTPVADVAGSTLVQWGVIAVVLAAVLALVSTANAGLLSASRYPFAMSRDQLAPAALQHVSDRFDTPTTAITLTGAVMLAMIAFVPIDDIAKLGSAFKILVFILVNVALVAFREGSSEGYEPSFRDPFYPWSQAVGVTGGLALLTQMGAVPLVGAAVILSIGFLWYLGFVRTRVQREGVARQSVRERVSDRVVERTRAAFYERADGTDVTVVVSQDADPKREDALVQMGATLARRRDGSVTVVRFDVVPSQLPLGSAAEIQSPDDLEFEQRMEQFQAELDVPLEFGEIVSHDTRHAVVNFVRHHETDLLLMEGDPVGARSWMAGDDVEWVVRHTPCDLLLVTPTRYNEVRRIALITDDGPFDPIKVEIADALAQALGARIDMVHALPSSATEEQRATIRNYHDELVALCTVPVESHFLAHRSPQAIAATIADDDLIVVGSDESLWNRVFDRRQSRRIVETFDGASIVVHPHQERTPGPLRRLIERVAF